MLICETGIIALRYTLWLAAVYDFRCCPTEVFRSAEIGNGSLSFTRMIRPTRYPKIVCFGQDENLYCSPNFLVTGVLPEES